MKRIFTLLLLLTAAGFVHAQTSDLECALEITPSDTVVYVFTSDSVAIPLTLSYADSIISLAWTGGNIEGLTTENPTTINAVNTTNTYTANVAFESNRNLVSNGDFEHGNSGFQSSYTYAADAAAFSTSGGSQGKYSITSNPNSYDAAWTSCSNHGLYLIADGALNAGVTFYSTTVIVNPYTDYAFYVDVANLVYPAQNNYQPVLKFYINGELQQTYNMNTQACVWTTMRIVGNSGESNTMTFSIVDDCLQGSYNDLAIDNVKCHEICYATANTTIQTIAVVTDEFEAEICEGETYTFHGVDFSEATTYTDTIMEDGLMRISILHLSVNPVYTTPIEATICDNQTYNFLGRIISEAGEYIDTLQTYKGCDSVIVLTLSVVPTYDDTVSSVICQGETYEDFNFSESYSGVYTQRLETVNGCDSLMTLNLKVNPSYYTEYIATTGEDEPYTYYGFNADSSGIYYQYLQTENGCDSIIALNLTVNRSLIIYTPNVIMPGREGDDEIRYFHLYPNSDDYVLVSWKIFNRWGTLVFESEDINDYWDGTYNGKLCPQGTYVYRVQFHRAGVPDVVADKTGEVFLLY